MASLLVAFHIHFSFWKPWKLFVPFKHMIFRYGMFTVYITYNGPQIFKKPRIHHQMLISSAFCLRHVTWYAFLYVKKTLIMMQILGSSVQNWVVWMTRCFRFVHHSSCNRLKVLVVVLWNFKLNWMFTCSSILPLLSIVTEVKNSLWKMLLFYTVSACIMECG